MNSAAGTSTLAPEADTEPSDRLASPAGRPPGPGPQAARRRRILPAAAIAVLVLGVGALLRVHWGSLTRVDAPFTLRTDKRLSSLAPSAESVVRLPVTIRWKVTDFPLTDGNQFGVFINAGFPSAGSDVRVRVCSKLAKQPPAPGELRGICRDQREQIFFTTDTSFTIDCLEPHLNRGARRIHDHEVSIILVDKHKRRVGETAITVPFTADVASVRACRGFD